MRRPGIKAQIKAVEERADDRAEKIRERARRDVQKVREHEREKIEQLRSGADGKLSEEGAAFIASWEGLELKAYVDPVGVLTIGVGHTGIDVKPGMTITRERAFELLQADAAKAAKAVTDLVKVPLNQNQEDVLISFTFNCGITALLDSDLLELLNEKKYDQVPEQLMRWVNVPPLEGLVNRRRAECALWRKKP